MDCTKVTACDVPICISELTAGVIVNAENQSLWVSFANVATGKVKWAEATTDNDGLLTIDLSEISTFFSTNNTYILKVHEAVGNTCADYEMKFTIPDGGEVSVDAVQFNFVKVNAEIDTFGLKVTAIECCDDSGTGMQYVPLTRVLTINGVSYDLSQNREWTVTAPSVQWGNVTGDINNQSDLISLLSSYALASDLEQEKLDRQIGDTATLAAANAYADGLVTTVFRPVGGYDASSGTWPSTGSGTGGSVRRGDTYNVTVAGTIGPYDFDIGDNFYANVNNPGQTDANWSRFENSTQQATEVTRGTARIASQAVIEAPATLNDTDIVTPRKFWMGITKMFTDNPFAVAVRATLLSGLSVLTDAPIDSGDSIIGALGKIQAQINSRSTINLDIVIEPNTSRILSSTDNGKMIRYTNAAGCAVTIPDTLGVGFNCLHEQNGAAQVTFAGSGSMSVVNADSHTKTAKLNAIACTIVRVANVTNLNGYTGT